MSVRSHFPRVISLYTDGGCRGNPGLGAWAFVIVNGEDRIEESGFSSSTTNNIMELTAALCGLEKIRLLELRGVIEVNSDSQYLLKGMTEWMSGWKKKGWRTSSGDPVKNRELWEKLDAVQTQLRPKWVWVKGHAGHSENERCDLLVNEVMDKTRDL